MLELGDNVWNGVLINVKIDEKTGRIQVFMPFYTTPSTDPILEVDPSVTIAVLTSCVATILATVSKAQFQTSK